MTDEEPESDIRRRAAYLLGMLALVAALFVVLMVVFFNSSGGDPDGPDGIAGPSDEPTTSAPATSAPASSSSAKPGSSSQTPPTSSSSSTAPSTGGSSGSSLPTGGSATCPPDAPKNKVCALEGDVGHALDAINAYRAENGKNTVPGSISEAAQRCAVNNGSGCKGGWAETQLAKADGKLAVNKIQKFGKLLSDMKSIEIGWAYDPGAKQYYFAIIRQD